MKRNQNTDKTHCKRGHLLEGENLYVNPSSNQRVCRICARKSALKHHHNKRMDAIETALNWDMTF